MDAARLSVSAGWRYSSYGWRVLSSHFPYRSCHAFLTTGSGVLHILSGVRGDGTIWIDSADADTLYCLSRLTILESHRTIKSIGTSGLPGEKVGVPFVVKTLHLQEHHIR